MNGSTSPTTGLDPEARLKHAAYVGDLAGVHAALADGADPATRDGWNRPLVLRVAMGQRDPAQVVAQGRSLADDEADRCAILARLAALTPQPLDAVDPLYPHSTALHEALGHHRLKLVEWLLAHGAPVEAKTIQGITPLASLFFGNHLNHVSPQAVALLHHYGADWSAPCGPAGQPRTCAQAYLAHDPDRAAPLLADWSAQQLAQQLQGANALPALPLERSRPRL